MNHDVIDRLRHQNPFSETPPLTPEREAYLVHAAKTELSGPLRRSWIAAAAVGLVLGIGIMTIWFGGAERSVVEQETASATTDAPDESGPVTTLVNESPTIADPVGIIEPLKPISIECSTQLNDTSLACDNLIDGTDAYWNDASLQGAGAVITVTFAEPVQLEQIQFINVADDASFRRNHRIRGIEIITDDLEGLPFIQEIPNDNDRPHAVTTSTFGTTQLKIRITSTWPGEAIDGRAFDELALDEIQFWGRSPHNAIGERSVTSGGFVAMILEHASGSCVTVAETSELWRGVPDCPVQPGPEISALAFTNFTQSATVVAGFAPINSRIEIRIGDVVINPVQSENVWIAVIPNGDWAADITDSGTVVAILNGSILEEVSIIEMETP